MHDQSSGSSRWIRELLTFADGSRSESHPRRGAVVYNEETASDHVYYLESGIVKLERGSEGGKTLLLTLVGPDEIFGEEALLGREKFSAIARVLEPATIHAVPASAFTHFCNVKPGLWHWLLGRMVDRQLRFERRVEHLCLGDARTRLMCCIYDLAHLMDRADEDRGTVRLSQSELASLVGATRETTSTLLNALAREGLLALGHRTVIVPSLEALRRATRPSGADFIEDHPTGTLTAHP